MEALDKLRKGSDDVVDLTERAKHKTRALTSIFWRMSRKFKTGMQKFGFR